MASGHQPDRFIQHPFHRVLTRIAGAALAAAQATAAMLSPDVELLNVTPETHVAAGIRLLTQLCDLAAKLPALCHVLDVRGAHPTTLTLECPNLAACSDV